MQYSETSDSEEVRLLKTHGDPEMPGDPVIVPFGAPEVPLDEFHPGISMDHRISFRFRILMTRAGDALI